jgi:hypothetical protein
VQIATLPVASRSKTRGSLRVITSPNLLGGPGGKGVAVAVGVEVGAPVGSKVRVPVGVRAGDAVVGVQVALGDGVIEGVGLRGVRVGVGVGATARGRQAARSASRLALLSPANMRRRLRRAPRL